MGRGAGLRDVAQFEQADAHLRREVLHGLSRTSGGPQTSMPNSARHGFLGIAQSRAPGVRVEEEQGYDDSEF